MNNDDELRNDDYRIESVSIIYNIEHSYFYIYYEVFVYFITLRVLHCETYGVHRFGKQVLNI